MGILIPVMLLIAMVTMGAGLINNASTTSVAAVADSWKVKEDREGEQFRTDLLGLTAAKTSSTTLQATLRNSGETALAYFDDWDIIIRYTASGTTPYATRLTRTTGALGSNQWKLTGIYNSATTVAEVFNPNVLDPGEEAAIQIKVSPAMATGTSVTITIGTPNGIVETIVAAPPSPYYLHNNPTPPTGNTNQQQSLPMNVTAPTATTLYNYDQDRDAFAGRLVVKGAVSQSETNGEKFQTWQTDALPGALTLSGNVSVELWSAMKDFNNSTKRGSVRVYLRDYDGASYAEIANGTLTVNPWDSQNTWVKKTMTITVSPDYTIAAGNRLEVKLIVPTSGVGGGSQDDMWFAYDTTAYPSVVYISV